MRRGTKYCRPVLLRLVLHIIAAATSAVCVLVRETLHVSLHGAAHGVGVMGGIFVFSSDVVFSLLMFVLDRGSLCFFIGISVGIRHSLI